MGGTIKKNVILGLTIVLAYAASYASASGCQNANCPAYNGTSIIVPNPDECESFCVCTCDGAVYMPCPAGLHYNKECHMCDWPSHAGCDPSGTTKPPPVTPPKQNGCEKVQPLCPSTNQGNATLLPNPDDCGSYCACDWGNAIWMPCPPGLHFNPTLKVCDYPDHAGCEPGPTPPPTTTSKAPSTIIDDGCQKVKPLCPPTNIGNATLLPNPDDCGSYCVCDWGNTIWMPCPPGLHFNPILKVCDWPANAGCEAPVTTSRPPASSTRPPPPPGACDKVKPLCPPTNEANATLLPNPDDCGSYCVCDWGNAIWMPCPAGLHFNPVLKVCDWPANAGCEAPVTTSRPPASSTRPPPPPGACDKVKPLCPPTNEGNATLLPNPDDCGSYCVCDWGNAIWMPCPAGLHFNPILKVCDWPANAGCEAPVTTSRPPASSTRPPPPPGACDKVKPLCPPTNEGNATLLPNPDDCGSYCVCDWGNAIWMPCPAGLHFNPVLKVCDWPANAGCEAPVTTSRPPASSTRPPPPPGACDKVKPLCPPTNEGNATLLPNPDDCGSYCVCDWGNAIWMPCPAGLHFNPVLKVCDWPANAGCEAPVTTSRPPASSTRPPPPPGACDKVKPLCPPTNEGNATLLPNPDDCGSYCVCDWGNAIWMPCPAGLHFNPILKVCDWPANAGCEAPVTTSRPPASSTRPPPPPGACDKVKPLCPPTNEGNATLLPNPDDCGSYCVCDWGNAIWMPCPAGLHFNPILKVCDWPANAGCEAPVTTSRPPASSTRPPPPPGACDKVKPLCPPTNEGNATLLPNPDDCGSYCVCDWGNAIWMPCPAGLHFNPILKVCDWPADAGCDGSISTAKPPKTTTKPNTDPGKCDKVKPLCPPTNEGNATLLPNPDDCGSYCVCDWGNAIWMPCPDGLHFNPVLHVCDWPANAGCEAPVTTSRPPASSTRPPPPPGSCDKVKPLCPPTNEGNATLLPNPDDCGSYCVCDWGNAIWMPCPDGLHFNPVLHVCDWPDHAGCDGNKPTTSGTPRPTTRLPPPPGKCDKVKPLCPPINEGNATLLPNPDDCGSYCVCDWGNAIWMPCPDGLHFNPILKVCDWPADAGCEGPTPQPTTARPTTRAPTTPEPTTPRPTTQAPTTPKPTTPKPTTQPPTTPEPTTPKPTTQAPTTPEPTTPKPTTRAPTTPEPTTPRPTTQAPTTPEPTTPKPTTRAPTTPAPTTPKPTTVTTNTPPHGRDGCYLVADKCPIPENPDHATLLANPWDPRSYCKCDWGKVHWMPCDPGTVFNEKLQVCI